MWRKPRLALFEAIISQSKPWQGGPAAVPITRLVSSGAEYTPLRDECQYLVAIFFFNAIECACSAETLRTKVLKFGGLSGRSGGFGAELREAFGLRSLAFGLRSFRFALCP